MDLELSGHDKRIYEVWLRSPSVFSCDPSETILAFKIGMEIGFPASRVLKALRAQPGLDEALMRAVDDFVAQDPSLGFTREGDGEGKGKEKGKERRVRFLG
jgi:hypothetical protein